MWLTVGRALIIFLLIAFNLHWLTQRALIDKTLALIIYFDVRTAIGNGGLLNQIAIALAKSGLRLGTTSWRELWYNRTDGSVELAVVQRNLFGLTISWATNTPAVVKGPANLASPTCLRSSGSYLPNETVSPVDWSRRRRSARTTHLLTTISPLRLSEISLAPSGIAVVVTWPPGQRTQMLNGFSGVAIT
jgi:hypothetical protein